MGGPELCGVTMTNSGSFPPEGRVMVWGVNAEVCVHSIASPAWIVKSVGAKRIYE